MSRAHISEHQQFDTFTVLLNVEEIDIGGRVFHAFDVNQLSNAMLVGYDTSYDIDVSPILGKQSHQPNVFFHDQDIIPELVFVERGVNEHEFFFDVDASLVKSLATLSADFLPEDMDSTTVYGENSSFFPSDTAFIVLEAQGSTEVFLTIVSSISPRDDVDKTSFVLQEERSVPADVPIIDAEDVLGLEDQLISLDVSLDHYQDGGEDRFLYTITDVPDGSSFSVGSYDGDGVWIFSSQELSHLSFIAPEHFSGDIDLALTALAIEGDGNQVGRVQDFTIHVDAVADEAIVSASGFGREDQDISLDLSVALQDQDGSEAITEISISNIPYGVTFSAGNVIGDVLYLSESDLDGLTLRAPSDSNQDFFLLVHVETTDENGTRAIVSKDFRVDLNGVADAPDVFAQDAVGKEDMLIDMDFSGALNDLDGSERLFFDVRDIPDGMSFTTGRAINGGKHWRFNNINQAEDAQMLAPKDFSGDLQLTFRAYARENDGNRTYRETDFKVSVSGEADAPLSFSVRESRGFEDNEIQLDIRYQLADTDGSESFSIIIDDVPNGAHFSHGEMNSDGTWTVLQDDIHDLRITPPLNSNEDFTLSVTGVVTEAGGDVLVFDHALDLSVSVRGVADAPSLDTSFVREGYEDELINLSLDPILTDADGSESLSVLISSVPEGVLLSPNGTYVSDGVYSYAAQDLSNLQLIAPTDFSGEFELDIRVVAQENDGDVEIFNTEVEVVIHSIADTPSITGRAIGLEDTVIDLNIQLTAVDRDGSEIVADTVLIQDVPDGAMLSAGIDHGDGSYTLSLDQLVGLQITPSEHSNANFSIRVTTSVVDSNGDETSATQSLPVTIIGDADSPILNVQHADSLSGEIIPLTISGALVDGDGSEKIYYILDDVPETYHVNGGIHGGNNRWIVRAENIDDITLQPLMQDFSDFQISVTAVSVENDGDISHTQLPLNITVHTTGVSNDLPTTLPMSDVPRFGNMLGDTIFEDTQIDVDGTIHYTAGSELSFLITDIPDGVEPNLGFSDLNGGLIVPLDQIAQLRFEPQENFSGRLDITYEAIQIQQGKAPSSVEKAAHINVEAVADAPMIVVSSIRGAEDSDISIPIDIHVVDLDGSEFIQGDIHIENIPEGGVLSAGIDLGGGVWSVPYDELDGIYFTPPQNVHGTFLFTIKAGSVETGNSDVAYSSKTISVTVDAVADEASVSVSVGTAREDEWLDLDIDAQFSDGDGSEKMTIVISGLPEEARLSAGANNGDGQWTLTPEQTSGLKVRAPDDFGGQIDAMVTVNTIEVSGDVTVVSQNVQMSFDAVSDGVIVDSVLSYNAVEDVEGGIPLRLNLRTLDRDGSETLEALFSGVPAGGTFSHGEFVEDGVWLVRGEGVHQLSFFPEQNFSGDIRFDVHASSTDVNGDRQGVSIQQDISISSKADTPELMVSVTSYEADAGESIKIDLSAQLDDLDGSEALSLNARGVPDDVQFSNGDDLGNGHWIFDQDDLHQISLQTSESFDGEFALTLQAQSSELVDGDTAYSDSFEVFFLVHGPVPSNAIGAQSGWVEVMDGGDVITLSTESGWVDSVEVLPSDQDIQGGDAFDTVLDSSQNADLGNSELQDQLDGGFFS